MIYKTFLTYNERSKKVNGKLNIVYLNDVRGLDVKNADDLNVLKLVTNREDFNEFPENIYCCKVEILEDYWSGITEVLLSSLYLRVMCCECWVANPEILGSELFKNGLSLLSDYTPISFDFREKERLLYIKLDGVTAAVCSLPELLEDNAAEIIFMKVLKNIRAYGVVTCGIEKRLLKEIQAFLNSEEFCLYRDLGIGIFNMRIG